MGHGTRRLLAALVVPTGQVLGSVTGHRGTWDLVRHVRDVVERSPQAQRFHGVTDNLNTHYTFALCQYLGRLSGVWQGRPRLRTGAQRRAFLRDARHKHGVHYTPRHGSWLNQVEIGDEQDAHPYEWTYTGKPLVSGVVRRKKKRIRQERKRLVNMRSG